MLCLSLPSCKLSKEETLCLTLAYKKTHVNWDEPKELNPLKSLTLQVKLKRKFKYFPTSLTYLPTYMST
jgi:hypothetical protein